MSALGEWWGETWGKVERDPAILPTTARIPAARTDKPQRDRFRRDAHYFEVTVNRIFLKYDRELWTTYAPMALVVSEFQYDGENIVVPFIVGPSLLEKSKVELPDHSFVFHDTRVVGLHPYKGGGLTLTVILYKVKRTDTAKQLLKVVERMSSALDFSQVLSTYLKVAGVLIDTVSEVIGSDKDNKPLIGFRKQFAAGDDFAPGYFVVADGSAPNPDQWCVFNKDLKTGTDEQSAAPYTDSNFVLFSIGQEAERDDYEKFPPFGDLWKQVKSEATRPKQESWEMAKAAMSTLYQAMVVSADLTEDHAIVLNNELIAKLMLIRKNALANVKMGAEPETAYDNALTRRRENALDILKL